MQMTPVQPVPLLTRWGVSAHADLVYRALVNFGPRSAAELGRSLRLPVRSVLQSLDELHGLAAAQIQQAARRPEDHTWLCCPPQTVVATLRHRQAELALTRKQLHRQLSLLDLAGVPPEGVRQARSIYDIPTAKQRFTDLRSAARHENMSMNPEAAFTASHVRETAPTNRSILRHGVSILDLGVPAAVEDESDALSSELHAYGHMEYRELPVQPIKLTIVDRTTAFIPIDPAVNFRNGIWEISCPATVGSLVEFFQRRWDTATAPATAWRPPASLSPREKAVLTAMASHDTDYGIAEALDLSVRTISATVKDVMERYGVQTRFQLGFILSTKDK